MTCQATQHVTEAAERRWAALRAHGGRLDAIQEAFPEDILWIAALLVQVSHPCVLGSIVLELRYSYEDVDKPSYQAYVPRRAGDDLPVDLRENIGLDNELKQANGLMSRRV